MIRPNSVTSEYAPIALGKFRGHAEYLRGPSDEPVASFDTWLADGIDAAHELHGASWDAIFQMGIPQGFIWRSDATSDAFCGIVAPSIDSIGRHYPLAIGVRVPHGLFATAPHLLPIVLRAFVDSAYATLSEARAKTLTREDLDERLRVLPVPTAESFAQAVIDYGAWCHAMSADQAWASLLPGAAPTASAWVRLQRLAPMLAGSPATARAVRLPLASSPAAATALWLDILRRASRGAATLNAFWAIYDGGLVVPIGAACPELVAELWFPTHDGHLVLDVALDDSEPMSSVQPPPSTTMLDFLEHIAGRE